MLKSFVDEDHFELHKVKERILEYLAVRQLKGRSLKGPIICFSGPPGVGKTSLGRSIAKATGREFVRMSLGGIKDEAEIRGHRRTYVGSMPGRFIQALKQAGTNNPVILLDEIDKLASDLRGDPSSALLEVLDPEQNNTFRDHYLNVPFDLSNVMFIATANVLESIPVPLRDRMEVLNLSGYTQEEKVAITKKYLIPKQIEENGIKESDIEIDDNAIINLIKNYTHEAGLRSLERCVGAVCRKVAKKIVDGNTEKFIVNAKTVEDLLGPPVFSREEDKRDDEIGVVSGLAVTSVGGEVLLIEVSKMKGKGFTFTGQLGDVMRESAQAAIGYIRSNAAELGINEDFFDNYEIHIHLPSGAIPKDGPSAGIALATGIVSLLTNKKVSRNIAMTGEITLTGKVLPIGGLKDKALAAMRLGINKVIVPYKNKKDLSEIPEEFKTKIEFVLVKHVSEVFEHALIFDEDEVEKFKQSSEKKKDKSKHRLAA
ncbi:MAG: endopeptidase La [Bacteriovoracaceae bacterium]